MFLDEDLISIVNRSIWSENSVGLFTVNAPLGNNVLLSSGVHPEEEATGISVNNIMNDTSFIKSLSNIKLYVVPYRNSIGNNLNRVLIESDIQCSINEFLHALISRYWLLKDLLHLGRVHHIVESIRAKQQCTGFQLNCMRLNVL